MFMMIRSRCSRVLSPSLALLALAVMLPAAATATPAHPLLAAYPGANGGSAPGAAPLLFIQNAGQFASGARFQVWGGRTTLWLADDAIWLDVVSSKFQVSSSKFQISSLGATTRLDSQLGTRNSGLTTALRLSFVGASAPCLVPFDRLATRVSYFRGRDAAGWRADVPVYGGARYEGLYPGIDLVLSGAGGALRPQLVAQPGADLSHVRLHVDGASSLRLATGGLLMTTAIGSVTFPLLTVASSSGAAMAPTSQPQLTHGDVTAPFANQRPDSALSVPSSALLYSTYLGGGSDGGRAITVDTAGNAYVTGDTESSSFPTTPGAFQRKCKGGCIDADAFVAKLNPTGTGLVYATFLGGSATDFGNGIAVDRAGNAYVAGVAESNDFPVTAGAVQTVQKGSWDAFVTKLNPTGTKLVYSTYLGGSDSDQANAIAIDASGTAYVTGYTLSPDFPVTSQAYQQNNFGNEDAFITAIAPSGGSFVYSTYLGGLGNDIGMGIAVDAAGQAHVAGFTDSQNFPTTSGVFQPTLAGASCTGFPCGDAFVVVLNATGSNLVYGSYLGGSGSDTAYAVAIDTKGNTYVAGITTSTNFPVTNGVIQPTFGGGTCSGGNPCYDGFAAKVNPTGTQLLYATYLGGSADDYARGIAVDSTDAAYVSGYSGSGDMPVTPGAYQESSRGSYNAFVVRLNPQGSGLVYATYLGGTGADFGSAVAVDSADNAYLTGSTMSSDFPVTPGAFQSQGFDDVFVTKLSLGGLQPVCICYEFTGYDNVSGSDTLFVTNPSAAITVSVSIALAGKKTDSFTLGPGRQVQRAYPKKKGGPLVVTSLTGLPLIVSHRMLVKQNFHEDVARLVGLLTADELLPGYDTLTSPGAHTLALGNPNTDPISVTVTIGQQVVATQEITAGKVATLALTASAAGIIEVTANDARTQAPAPVAVTEYVVWNGQANDVMSTPRTDLTADVLLAGPDPSTSAQEKDWIVAANPANVTETISISVAGLHVAARDVAAGQQLTLPLTTKQTGAIEVTATLADGTPAPVLVTRRVLWHAASRDDVPGADRAYLDSSVWLSYYDGKSTAGHDWLVLLNPGSDVITATITVGASVSRTIGSISPLSQILVNLGNTVASGPVHITATDADGSASPIYAAQRTLWRKGLDFSETSAVGSDGW